MFIMGYYGSQLLETQQSIFHVAKYMPRSEIDYTSLEGVQLMELGWLLICHHVLFTLISPAF